MDVCIDYRMFPAQHIPITQKGFVLITVDYSWKTLKMQTLKRSTKGSLKSRGEEKKKTEKKDNRDRQFKVFGIHNMHKLSLAPTYINIIPDTKVLFTSVLINWHFMSDFQQQNKQTIRLAKKQKN